jgi:hypothetical protein
VRAGELVFETQKTFELTREVATSFDPMNHTLADFFRCPDDLGTFETSEQLSENAGFFQLGRNATCYGRCSNLSPANSFTSDLPDALQFVRVGGQTIDLPFDFAEVTDNLRRERYPLNASGQADNMGNGSAARRIYYVLRPLLPIQVRKHLQRIHLNGWDQVPFPHWPVDFSVESLMEQGLLIILNSGKAKRVPFIWFWPDGAPSCSIMTHDVEASAGRDMCNELMNMDESFGVKSAFQVVPEGRYEGATKLLEGIRNRGFEVNVHDLNHDGSLFLEEREFRRRADRINKYVADFGTQGFRSGAMYRNQDWYSAFDFSYDMSVPNVAHLEPQRGGCCTVMPYFIGKILELPLTTIQDYSLFHILDDYSINLWKHQIDLILKRNGLISFIIHPDYMIEKRARSVYAELLQHLVQLREERNLWIALPGEVNRWWRNRSQMKLVSTGDGWKIEGSGCDRARLAYATLDGDRLVYTLENKS